MDQKPQRGVTLIELMVSIAVIAIIASLAAPSFSSVFADRKIKGLGGEIMSDLYFAKMESAQSNSCIAVDFSATGYTIRKLAPYPAPPPCTIAAATTITTIKTVTISGNNTITPTSGTTYLSAIFDPVRTTATVAMVGLVGATVDISNSGASSKSLRISVSTLGRPQICSPNGTVSGFTAC